MRDGWRSILRGLGKRKSMFSRWMVLFAAGLCLAGGICQAGEEESVVFDHHSLSPPSRVGQDALQASLCQFGKILEGVFQSPGYGGMNDAQVLTRISQILNKDGEVKAAIGVHIDVAFLEVRDRRVCALVRTPRGTVLLSFYPAGMAPNSIPKEVIRKVVAQDGAGVPTVFAQILVSFADLNSGNPAVVKTAVQTLKQLRLLCAVEALQETAGSGAADALKEILKSAQGELFVMTVQALVHHNMQGDGEVLRAVTDRFKEAMKSRNGVALHCAAEAIGLIGNDALKNYAAAKLFPEMKEGRTEFEDAATQAFQQLGPLSCRFLAELYYRHKSEFLIDLLGTFEFAQEDVIGSLAAIAKDPLERKELRIAAITALGKRKNARAVPALREVLNSPSLGGRGHRQALIALKNIASVNAVPEIIGRLKDHSSDCFPVTVEAAGAIPDVRLVAPLLEALNREKEEVVRADLLRAIGRKGDLINETTADALMLYVSNRSESPLVRRSAAEALARIAAATSLPAVKSRIIPAIRQYVQENFLQGRDVPMPGDDFIPTLALKLILGSVLFQKGILAPVDIIAVYASPALSQEQDLSPARQFSIARSVALKIKKCGLSINGSTVGDFLPYIAAQRKKYVPRLMLGKGVHLIAACHSARQFNPAAIVDVAKHFGVKDIECFKGGMDRNLFFRAVRRSPENTTIWFNGHADTQDVWMGEGPDDVIQQSQWVDALVSRAGKHEGRLSDITILVDSCHSATIMLGVREALKERLRKGEIRGLPLIVTTTLDGFSYTPVFMQGVQSVAWAKDHVSMGDCYEIENFSSLQDYDRDTVQEIGFFMPKSIEDLRYSDRLAGLLVIQQSL